VGIESLGYFLIVAFLYSRGHRQPPLSDAAATIAKGGYKERRPRYTCIQLPCRLRVDIDGGHYAEKDLAEKYFVLRYVDILFCTLRTGRQCTRHSACVAGSASHTARSSGALLAASWD
jgi:hypothetical protein